MSTRGVYGFKKNGKLKVRYNQHDSYLEGLGQDVVDFCEKHSKDLHQICDSLEFTEDEDAKEWGLFNLEEILILDAEEFLKNTLFCEYSYIIDLDDNVLRISDYGGKWELDLDSELPEKFKSTMETRKAAR